MCAKNSDSNTLYSDIAYAYFHDICDIKPIPFEEQKALIKAAQNGNITARNTLIESFLRLVVSRAKIYSHNFDSFMDLVQEGNIGLIVAIQNFDVEKGVKFTTYATPWIDKYILRASPRTNNPIYLPEAVREDINRLLLAEKHFEQKHERLPTVDELADMLALNTKKITYLKNLSKPTISLNHEQEDSYSNICKPLLNFIADSTQSSPEEVLCSEATKTILLDFMHDSLTDTEFAVLSLRFGFGPTGRVLTFDELSEKCGLSKEGCRKAQIRAIKKLQTKIIKTGLQMVDFI